MCATVDPTNGFGRVTELIFLGTGTSSSLPHIECLTAPPEDQNPPCKTCLSTLTPAGKKNIRRNTSVALRMKAQDGRSVTIVIDSGKNFQAAALEWFPKYNLRRIDALLITHAHADAMNGLDDLRAWTLRSAIQSHIDVYVSIETFTEVQRSFPYLVAKEFASGGGDVPEFKWHIIDDQVPFEVAGTGIQVTPFAVHHGRYFSVAPAPSHIVTPSATLPSTPVKIPTPLPGKSPNTVETGIKPAEVKEQIYPYLSFGFKIEDHTAYISDVSYIPEHVWPILESRGPDDSRRLPVVVLDCLRLRPHTSHVGLEGSIALASKIRASRTYLTGFGHEVSHEEYVTVGEILGGAPYNVKDLTETEIKGVGLVGEERNLWVRPAHDGLRVFIQEEVAMARGSLNLKVVDESYL